MFDLQRYNALREAITICEKRLPLSFHSPTGSYVPWKLSEGRTKLIAVLTYLCSQMYKTKSDFRA
jgi:hypothetical protein